MPTPEKGIRKNEKEEEEEEGFHKKAGYFLQGE
jgi:hypothetical protein